VRPYSLENPYSSQVVLWSQPVAAANQSATYTGKALEPGQKYDWELVVDPALGNSQRFTFQVMEAQKRDRITAELTALETQLKAAGATAEEIALERANYFAERDLWSDALQEVYSVKNPSATLTQAAQEMSAWACKA
jgi:predicted Fe-Mo cluster-binding NifX family protein